MKETTALPRLPPRAPDAHKGSFGRILVIAGSRGMSGAAVLGGTAALKAGAGLVTVACPASIQDVVAAGCPCYMTHGLPDDAAGHITEPAAAEAGRLAKAADVLAIGPGLGTGRGVCVTISELLRRDAHPVVLDADGLNAISPINSNVLRLRQAPTILTPHPGEFARLTAEPAPATHDQRLAAAMGFAAKHKVIVLLKGHRSIVADGENYYVNTTGNPGMATGGAGDVLTGVIAALLGQRLSPFDATVLGTYLHGRAGDLAADAVGPVSLTALDLLAHLPAAFR